MTRARRSAAYAAAIAASVLLAGCGQRGPLFLPNEPPELEPVPAPAEPEPEPDDEGDEANER